MTNCISKDFFNSPIPMSDLGVVSLNLKKESLFAVAKKFFFSLPMEKVKDKQECFGRQVYASMNCWRKILHCTKSYQEIGAKFMEKNPLAFVRIYLKVFPENPQQVVVVSPAPTTQRESLVSQREKCNLNIPEEGEVDLLAIKETEAQRNALNKNECEFMPEAKDKKLSKIEESNHQGEQRSNLKSRDLSSASIPPSILENKRNCNSYNNARKEEEKYEEPPKDLFAEVVEISVQDQDAIPSPILSPGPLAIASAATIRQPLCPLASPTPEENS